jgi:hypothetical protein
VSALGNTIVKFPEEDDLSDPKSNIHTALSLFVSLYISAPLAVIVADPKVLSAKSTNAVVCVCDPLTA